MQLKQRFSFNHLQNKTKSRSKMIPKWSQKWSKKEPGAPWGDLGLENAPKSVLGAFPGEPPTPNYTFFAPRESSFISLEVCFVQKVDSAGRLFAIHFLGVFRADFGGSAPVKMWFW